ncbi:hypothetical protein HYW74_02375 [Candidatus Pacearchaeota archaeon]|nr:hypothetical protein [Candidatus Pacearchaeota archaeon]
MARKFNSLLDNQAIKKVMVVLKTHDYFEQTMGKIVPVNELRKQAMHEAKKAGIEFTDIDFDSILNQAIEVGYFFEPAEGYIQKF